MQIEQQKLSLTRGDSALGRTEHPALDGRLYPLRMRWP